MVVTDLRPNLIRITKTTGYATLNPHAKDIRRVIAEDEEWSLKTVPLLKDLTLDHIVKNFKSMLLSYKSIILRVFVFEIYKINGFLIYFFLITKNSFLF